MKLEQNAWNIYFKIRYSSEKNWDIYPFCPKNTFESDDAFPFWVWWKSPVDFQAVQVDHFSFRPTVGPPQWNQQSATNGTAWILGLSAEKIWKNAGKNVGLFVWRIQWIRHVPYLEMHGFMVFCWLFLFICRQSVVLGGDSNFTDSDMICLIVFFA